MDTLTIRNLSVSLLELTLVERIDPTQGVVRSSWRLFGGGSSRSGTTANGSPRGNGEAKLTSILTDEKRFGQMKISGCTIPPFEAKTTDVRPATDSKRSVLRLTFSATALPAVPDGANGNGNGNGTYHRDHRTRNQQAPPKYTYTLDLPPASPHGVRLTPADGGEKKDGPASAAAPSFAVVYTPERAHLAIMSKISPASWMADIDGSWPLSSLSIPGTHNSPACFVSAPSVRCQAEDVLPQLLNGARFLDVRVSVGPTKKGHTMGTLVDPKFTLVHAIWPVSVYATRYFSDLYADVCAFLDANPTETVLMSLKREGTGRGTDVDLAQQLFEYYVHGDGGQKNPNPNRWYIESHVPSLDEVRGKIVLVRRFHLTKELKSGSKASTSKPGASGSAANGAVPSGGSLKPGAPNSASNGASESDVAGSYPMSGRRINPLFPNGFGLDASEWPDNCAEGECGSGIINFQDFYGVMQTAHIAQKIEYCRNQLARTAERCYSKLEEAANVGISNGVAGRSLSRPPVPLYLNFLSGSNFFNKSCWPEKVAAQVNPAVVEYLCVEHGEGHTKTGNSVVNAGTVAMGDNSTGIVVTDWVGLGGDWDLVQCIVAWNARLQLKS